MSLGGGVCPMLMFKSLFDDAYTMRLVRLGAILFGIIGASLGLDVLPRIVDSTALSGVRIARPDVVLSFIGGMITGV